MGESLKSFEELECWRACTEVRRYVMNVIKKFPSHERYSLCDDMTRAARSSTHNIAEGFGRFHYQEKIQFCRQSRGSLQELIDQCITAYDEHYLNDDEFRQARVLIDRAMAVLNGYINYLGRAKNNYSQLTDNR